MLLKAFVGIADYFFAGPIKPSGINTSPIAFKSEDGPLQVVTIDVQRGDTRRPRKYNAETVPFDTVALGGCDDVSTVAKFFDSLRKRIPIIDINDAKRRDIKVLLRTFACTPHAVGPTGLGNKS